jgi:hypothetical protein
MCDPVSLIVASAAIDLVPFRVLVLTSSPYLSHPFVCQYLFLCGASSFQKPSLHLGLSYS